jgi:hypothetical protein
LQSKLGERDTDVEVGMCREKKWESFGMMMMGYSFCWMPAEKRAGALILFGKKSGGWDENRYAKTFGGNYGFKDGVESMILSACTENIILSELPAESVILSAPPTESMILSVRSLSQLSPLLLSPSPSPSPLLLSDLRYNLRYKD